MSPGEKLLLGLGAVVAGAFFLAGVAATGEPPEPDDDAGDGLDLSAHLGVSIGDDYSRPDLCQPSDMGDDVLRQRHPLYRRVRRSRPAHHELSRHGWSMWLLDPPSDATEF